MFWINKTLQRKLYTAELKLKNMDSEILLYKQEHRIEFDKKLADYELKNEKKQADIERVALDAASLAQREHKALVEKLKLEHATKIDQLELEKKTAVDEVTLLAKGRIQDAKIEAEQKLVDHKSKVSEEFYAKLSTELAKLHSEGNVGTKFVQDIAMRMAETAPNFKGQIEINKSGSESVKK